MRISRCAAWGACSALWFSGCFAPSVPNRLPQLTSETTVSVEENEATEFYRASAFDPDRDDSVSFSISGPDAALFVMDSNTGALRFAEPPDADSPQSENGSNTYRLTLELSDSQGGRTSAALSVSVIDVIELNVSFEIGIGTSSGTLRFSWTPAGDEREDVDVYRIEVDRLGTGAFVPDETFALLDGSQIEAEVQAPLHLLNWATAVYRIVSLDPTNQVLAESNTVVLSDTVASEELIEELESDAPEVCNAFGTSVAVSADGNTVAVGASFDADGAGVVFVFQRQSTGWVQDERLLASNTDARDLFGTSVALSGSGATLVVGAPGEASAATGVNGSESDNSAAEAGASYVFRNSNRGWGQVAYLKAGNAEAGDEFGRSVAVSSDGTRIVIGARREDSDAAGVNSGGGSQNGALDSGAVYIFNESNAVWTQDAYLKSRTPRTSAQFGETLSLADNGSTLAVGVPNDATEAQGIDPAVSNEDAPSSGAVYVYAFNGAEWSEQAFIKASNSEEDHYFGGGIALSADGDVMAVGAPREDGGASGVNASPGVEPPEPQSGAVYLFERNGQNWSQTTYFKPFDNSFARALGNSVALSDDGLILVAGAITDPSSSIGLGGAQGLQNALSLSGAAYAFQKREAWEEVVYIKAPDTRTFALFGSEVALSSEGRTLAVGAFGNCVRPGGSEESGDDTLGGAYIY